MKLNLYKNKIAGKSFEVKEGFSLIETVIALTTLGICLAYAMPLFLYAKINNSKSDIRTGALIVSQRVFDNIRSQSMLSLPSNDGVNSANASNPITLPINANTTAMGRQYQTKVIYCENVNTDPTVCGNQYRQFRVEVSYNGTKVYDLQGTFTQFQ